MSDVRALFADYASYHQTKGNKAFHRLGIPLIVLSLFGMLARVTWTASYSLDVGGLAGVHVFDAATLLIVAATIYYLTVEWRLAIAMFFVSVVFYVIGALLPMWVNVALFILGWIFQFIGHSVYEHKQPAFFRNFVHLLVGPLWILNDIIPVVKRA
jgi:uncharacterized membrane protein YGL010W